MANPFVGEIRIFAGTFAPNGWAFCDGSTIAIADNDTLFQLIGTTYGGNGTTTFALPDLRGRIPVHFGTSTTGVSYTQGQTGGTQQVTLTPGQLPTHNHTGALQADSRAGNKREISGNVLAAEGTGQNAFFAPPSGVLAMAPGNTSSVGSGQPHENMPPYVVINFIISLYGVFPSQN